MSRRFLMTVGLLAGFLLLCGVNEARAKTVAPSDARAIAAVVRAQLQALATGDAERAFVLMTPAMRSEVGDQENLLRIIKEQYEPMYRHRLVIFTTPETADGGVTQTVRITAHDNKVWLVIYEMERDSDGAWRIDGWRLLETTTISV